MGSALPALIRVSELRTEVREDGIRLRFVPFHLRVRTWRWDEIADIVPRAYSPILEYGGWGLRLGLSGWAYNVKGHLGIELVLESGRRILIGTQRPGRFMRAVEAATADGDG